MEFQQKNLVHRPNFQGFIDESNKNKTTEKSPERLDIHQSEEIRTTIKILKKSRNSSDVGPMMATEFKNIFYSQNVSLSKGNFAESRYDKTNCEVQTETDIFKYNAIKSLIKIRHLYFLKIVSKYFNRYKFIHNTQERISFLENQMQIEKCSFMIKTLNIVDKELSKLIISNLKFKLKVINLLFEPQNYEYKLPKIISENAKCKFDDLNCRIDVIKIYDSKIKK